MEPVSILLLAGAGALLLKGGRGSGPSAPTGQAAVGQGVAVIQAAARPAPSIVAQAQAMQQGLNTKLLTTALGGVVAGVTTGLSVAGSAAGGVSSGVIAGAATFGVGAAVGIAMVLWAKHEARIKGAKTENAAWNLIYPGFVESIQGVFDAYNSKQLSTNECIAELRILRNLVFADATKYNHMPGVNWSGGSGVNIATVQAWYTAPCDKHCTIGCCLNYGIVAPAFNRAIALLQGKPVWYQGKFVTGAKSFTVPALAPVTKYGFKGGPSFTLAIK